MKTEQVCVKLSNIFQANRPDIMSYSVLLNSKPNAKRKLRNVYHLEFSRQIWKIFLKDPQRNNIFFNTLESIIGRQSIGTYLKILHFFLNRTKKQKRSCYEWYNNSNIFINFRQFIGIFCEISKPVLWCNCKVEGSQATIEQMRVPITVFLTKIWEIKGRPI